MQAKQNAGGKRYPSDMQTHRPAWAAGWAIVAVVATILCCALARPVDAVSAGATQIQFLADANKRFEANGVVTAVSYVSNTLTLDSDGRRLQILITPTTAIEIHGQAGSISDIRRGSKISTSGVVRNGAWIANSVVVH